MSDLERYYATYSPDKLSSYDYSEPYDENKKYEPHIANYGHGIRRYTFNIYNFKNNIKYAVANFSPSRDELQLLEPYCQCLSCSAPWWQHLLHIAPCACCFGCLKGPFPSENNMHLAHKKMLEK